MDIVSLQLELLALGNRIERLVAMLRLFVVLTRAPGSRLLALGSLIVERRPRYFEQSIDHVLFFRYESPCAFCGCHRHDTMHGSVKGNAVSTICLLAHVPRRNN